MSKIFDFKLVFTQIPVLLKYLPVTLELAFFSVFIGLLLGLAIALIKMKKNKILNRFANIYISLLRGTPILVQLYIAYFGIPMLFKYINFRLGTNFHVADIPGFVYAVFAMSLNQSAYNAEAIRAALQSVNKGEIEAANALGMTYFQVLRRIILPEALVFALPTLGNTIISAIKNTSLAFTCAVVEITAQGKILGGITYRYFEVYVSLAIIYWIITFFIEQIIKYLEKKMAIPDQVETASEEKIISNS